MRKFEVWVRGFGDIRITERNPCYCCPNDYNEEFQPIGKNRKPLTIYIGRMSRRKFLKRMRDRGFEKLGSIN